MPPMYGSSLTFATCQVLSKRDLAQQDIPQCIFPSKQQQQQYWSVCFKVQVWIRLYLHTVNWETATVSLGWINKVCGCLRCRVTPQWQSGSVALRATQAEPAGQTASHACMDKREDGWNHQGDMKTGEDGMEQRRGWRRRTGETWDVGGTVDMREGKRMTGQDPGRRDGRYVHSARSFPMVYLSKTSRPGPRTSLSLLGLKGPPDTTQANSSHSTLASSCLFPSTTEPDPAQRWQTHIPRRGKAGRPVPRLKEEHVLTKAPLRAKDRCGVWRERSDQRDFTSVMWMNHF